MGLAILLDTLEATFTDLVGGAMEGRISPPAEEHVVEILCTFSSAPHAHPPLLTFE